MIKRPAGVITADGLSQITPCPAFWPRGMARGSAK
jgi:hypothetical protein